MPVPVSFYRDGINMRTIQFNILRITGFLMLTLGFAGFTGCDDARVDQPATNQPPETHVFIEYADTLNYTSSVRSVSWYGDDKDGFVVGYYYTWKENPVASDWVYTTGRKEVFPLQIAGTDTIYAFMVKAVDDDGSEDPTPAVQRFPIKNTAPVLEWIGPLAVPDTTFTIATFFWQSSDIDGDSTISVYEWTLDDTLGAWHQIPGDGPDYLTLRESDGLVPGPHAFYLRAIDQAGAKSPVLRMPQDESRFFHVKPIIGNVLVIDDFLRSDADDFYRGVMDTLVNEYTYWDLKENEPPSTIPFAETLNLFKYVIWYADLTPHLLEAQAAIPNFRSPEVAGKIFFSMQFNTDFGVSQGNPLEFSPIAELDTFFNRMSTGKIFYTDSTDSYIDQLNLPQLKVSRTEFGVNTLVPKDNAHVLYRYELVDGVENDPVMAVLGENDNTGEKDFVFVAYPVQSLNGNQNAADFVSKIFRNVFGMEK